MKVYILLNCNHEGENFLGVYTSRYKAQDARVSYNNSQLLEYSKFPEVEYRFCEDHFLFWESANAIREVNVDVPVSKVYCV